MKIISKIISILLLMGVTTTLRAQLLFSESFDSYPIGHLNTDYTNTVVGQGGWLLSRDLTKKSATAVVTTESGKGKVVVLSSTGTDMVKFAQVPGTISSAWNNRTAGNNILKFEYEFFGAGIFNIYGDITNIQTLINIEFQPNLNRIIGNYWNNINNSISILQNYAPTTFPLNIWIKTEIYIDYTNKKAYFYIPTLNIFKVVRFTTNRIPDTINFGGGLMDAQSYVKFDNIKITALNKIPTHILTTNEQLATRFNLYPNPATSVVNITNAENMQIQQITVYDIAGKEIKKQTYTNENQIQLNVENLPSGMYILHLQTNEGLAIEKLVKM